MRAIFFFSVVLLLIFPATGHTQTVWRPYSSKISFKIKNAGMNVSGSFDTVSASLTFSPDNLAASSLSGKAVVNSIHTGIGKRDKDLKKADFFDVDNYKEIEVKSAKLYYKSAQYAGLFDVTIKGITKQMEIPFEFNPFADEATFKGSFTIDRKDFKVGGSSMMMGDKVTIDIEIKARK